MSVHNRRENLECAQLENIKIFLLCFCNYTKTLSGLNYNYLCIVLVLYSVECF